MNLETYLKNKKLIPKNLANKVQVNSHRCLKCFRSQKSCLCSEILPLLTKTQFIILMHPKEAKKERVGTGRLSHLSLINSKIIIGENFDGNEDVKSLIKHSENQCFILYPGSNSHNLNLSLHPLMNYEIPGQKNIIFVIDGTWSCAKSMMRDSTILHQLPRISFDSKQTSQFYIKQQPTSLCLSTIESLYQVLECLNQWGAEKIENKGHENFLYLLQKMCDFQKSCTELPQNHRYRPSRTGYKKSTEKKVSKKWIKRKIYFE
ncbi:MAG: DTW domain-containing protein [Bacteriovoracaceae bacterium]|nr:DTW domain-containing protein [Bacteriovoracaceae bacterium]